MVVSRELRAGLETGAPQPVFRPHPLLPRRLHFEDLDRTAAGRDHQRLTGRKNLTWGPLGRLNDDFGCEELDLDAPPFQLGPRAGPRIEAANQAADRARVF